MDPPRWRRNSERPPLRRPAGRSLDHLGIRQRRPGATACSSRRARAGPRDVVRGRRSAAHRSVEGVRTGRWLGELRQRRPAFELLCLRERWPICSRRIRQQRACRGRPRRGPRVVVLVHRNGWRRRTRHRRRRPREHAPREFVARAAATARTRPVLVGTSNPNRTLRADRGTPRRTAQPCRRRGTDQRQHRRNRSPATGRESPSRCQQAAIVDRCRTERDPGPRRSLPQEEAEAQARLGGPLRDPDGRPRRDRDTTAPTQPRGPPIADQDTRVDRWRHRPSRRLPRQQARPRRRSPRFLRASLRLLRRPDRGAEPLRGEVRRSRPRGPDHLPRPERQREVVPRGLRGNLRQGSTTVPGVLRSRFEARQQARDSRW